MARLISSQEGYISVLFCRSVEHGSAALLGRTKGADYLLDLYEVVLDFVGVTRTTQDSEVRRPPAGAWSPARFSPTVPARARLAADNRIPVRARLAAAVGKPPCARNSEFGRR